MNDNNNNNDDNNHHQQEVVLINDDANNANNNNNNNDNNNDSDITNTNITNDTNTNITNDNNNDNNNNNNVDKNDIDNDVVLINNNNNNNDDNQQEVVSSNNNDNSNNHNNNNNYDNDSNITNTNITNLVDKNDIDNDDGFVINRINIDLYDIVDDDNNNNNHNNNDNNNTNNNNNNNNNQQEVVSSVHDHTDVDINNITDDVVNDNANDHNNDTTNDDALNYEDFIELIDGFLLTKDYRLNISHKIFIHGDKCIKIRYLTKQCDDINKYVAMIFVTNQNWVNLINSFYNNPAFQISKFEEYEAFDESLNAFKFFNDNVVSRFDFQRCTFSKDLTADGKFIELAADGKLSDLHFLIFKEPEKEITLDIDYVYENTIKEADDLEMIYDSVHDNSDEEV